MPLNPLAAVSTWMTYLVQVAFAYLVVWGMCLLVRNARVRLRMLGGFLFLATSYWVFLAIPYGSPTAANALTTTGAAPSAELAPGWSWAIPQSVAAHSFRFSIWLLTAYIGIVLILLLQAAAKSWSLKRFLASGCEAPSEVNRIFEDVCREMRVGRCRLILITGLRSPATANWWRPYILLPAELALELDENQLANVLRHELIHIRRHDYLWDRLAAVACRVVFFHPVMWLAHRRLRWERELACDEAVVRYNDDHRVEYAECLTTLARWWFLADKNSRGAIGFASSASLLGTRVRALLVEPVSYSFYQRGARAALIAVVLAATAISLPGMRLNFYWSRSHDSVKPGPETNGITAARKIGRNLRRVITGKDSPAPTENASTDNGSAVALTSSSDLAVIEKPAMPVFAGEEQRSAPENVSGASGDGVATASGGSSSGVGPSLPQSTVKKPSWQDTAVDAITTGVAIIRSRTSAPSGTSGGGAPASGGGSSGGGSSGGEGGGEGPDHFTGPN